MFVKRDWKSKFQSFMSQEKTIFLSIEEEEEKKHN